MRTRSHAPLTGRLAHGMLDAAPLGLLAAAVVCDLIDLATGTGAFNVPAYWMLLAGVAGAALAALVNLLGWPQFPRGSPQRLAQARHGVARLVVMALFTGSWWLRQPELEVPPVALALSLAGAAIAGVAAWRAARARDSARADAPDSLLPADAHTAPPDRAPAAGAPW